MDLTQFEGLPDLHSAAISETSLEDLQHERILQKYASRFQIYVSDLSKYKFRPHAIGRLMGGIPKPLTERQAETLEAYDQKIKSGKGLTEKQYIDYGSLLAKKTAAPTLSTGAKTYLKDLFKEITFQRTTEIKSKYLDKGLACEPAALRMLIDHYGLDIEKNTFRLENDYLTGEPDIILPDEVWDIKSSWDYETFPMFDEELQNSMYYWQMLGYMDLLGYKSGRVVYVLVDTPEQIIYEEKRRVSWQLGLISEDFVFDLPEDLEFEIERNLRYEDIPTDARIKEFHVVYDEKDIKVMRQILDLARAYLVELSQSLEKRFINHIAI